MSKLLVQVDLASAVDVDAADIGALQPYRREKAMSFEINKAVSRCHRLSDNTTPALSEQHDTVIG